jgi:hypothetical protein
VSSKETEILAKELLLIGGVHRDPHGAVKLRKLLAEERPVSLAVEVSPYGLFYRRRNSRYLRRRLLRRVKRLARKFKVSWRDWGQINGIEIQLAVPFEYRMAQKYCRDTGAALACIDSSLWSKGWINEHWQPLMSRDNLEVLLKSSPETLTEEVEREYKIAARLLNKQEQALASAFIRVWSADPLWQQREIELAKALEDTYARVQEGRVAYVGGWQHLLRPSNGGTLYDRVEHLQPRRILLSSWEVEG